MADASDLTGSTRHRRMRHSGRWVLAGAGCVGLALGLAWGARERIAAGLIDRELAALGLPMHYRIESVGLTHAVFADLAVGDPAHPDATLARLTVDFDYGVAGPRLAAVTLDRLRLDGRLVDGALHFGALDAVLKGGGGTQRLPDWSLALRDARARIATPYGAIGLSADGAGRLADGFAGTLGVVAPAIHATPGCDLGRTTAYARIAVVRGAPRLDGPLRLGAIRCGGVAARGATLALGLRGDAALARWTLDAQGAADRIAAARALGIARLDVATGIGWTRGTTALGGHLTLAAHELFSPAVRIAALRFDGAVHAEAGTRADMRGDVSARDVTGGPGLAAALARARAVTRGSPIAPLVVRLGDALDHEQRGSSASGTLGLYAQRGIVDLAVPALALHGARATARATQLALHLGGRAPVARGVVTLEGGALPQIAARFSQTGDGGAHVALTMGRWSAGGASLAVPALTLDAPARGGLAFAGSIALSGPIGDGAIAGLTMPIDGRIVPRGGWQVLQRCTRIGFDAVRLGGVVLDRGAARLCPVAGGIVQAARDGVRIAADAGALSFSGRNGQTPLRLVAAHVRLAYPGESMLDAAAVALGDNRFRLDRLTIDPAAGPGGRFSGGSADLAALPATAAAASGTWAWRAGRLVVSDAGLVVADRAAPARFAPLALRGGSARLDGGVLAAEARVATPRDGATLATLAVRHDLSGGKGHADVVVPGLAFRAADKDHAAGLQPADLSDLAKGVIANANGTIRGTARFDWDAARADGGVSGSGTLATDDFDFAAAAGPVEGLAGTVEFTDLIHMVTAPHQNLRIASINPGVEVVDGSVDLQLDPGQVLRINAAHWPFEGGTLRLEPAAINLAKAEPHRFVVSVSGVEAGRFLQHINMANLAATGVFDGRLPLEFDGAHGRIVGGELVARPPGGNVSYVGALSYRDLSPMANFAFRMLRSLDYRTMVVGMGGDLDGEVVTRVAFSGLRQGKGAERNLLTRQLGKLPIQFNVNVRAPFYQMITSIRALYDPALVRDPRALGLVDAQGHALHHHGTSGSADLSIQPQASGTMP